MYDAGSHCLASFDPDGAVQSVLLYTGGVLVVASVLRILFQTLVRGEQRRDRLRSLGTWWVLYLLLVLAAWGGPTAVVILLASLSLLGLREFRRLTRGIDPPRGLWPAIFAVSLAHYAAIYFRLTDVARIGMPLVGLVVVVVVNLVAGRASGFLRSAAVPLLGLLLIVYCPSHAVMLTFDGHSGTPGWGDARFFLFLVLLTEGSDIAQAFWGRSVGSRKIVPTISPGKTWEGLVLGAVTTALAATLLAPLLAPPGIPPALAWQRAPILLSAAFGALLIVIAGFLGDICYSAIKRDCGVKDSGKILPGQGGVMDRIDSLSLSAPAFYYYVAMISMYS